MPSAEIVSIGTELLLGQILNTNTQFLSEELAAIGIDCFYHSTVGDNTARIIDCFKYALNRCDIIIATGGLGPTKDDLTTECIAELFGVPLMLDKDSLEKVKSFFSQRKIAMPESNSKQAMHPQGSQILPNPTGTAPGIIWGINADLLRKANISTPEKKRYILTFPGVPSEMKVMWHETAKPFLASKFDTSTIFSVDLKHYGISESALGEKYSKLLDLSNPTVAPLAGSGECRLRVTAKAKSKAEAQTIARPIIDEIKNNSGILCYGTDNESLEEVVGKLLTERKLKVAFAESCTGGLASKRMTDIPGSSKYIDLNVVTYSYEAKNKLLHVDQNLLDTKGAVDVECAKAMAEGVRQLANADIGIGITGIAGPEGGTKDKPVGLVFMAIAAKDFIKGVQRNYPTQLPRTEIRQRTTSDALNMIRLYLLEPKYL